MAKISVIMAVYNAAVTLRQAIESIQKQTYDNWEFVICDDASQDQSLEICQEYQAAYPDKFIII
ncbi:MAG: glycosyltransferase, partial [Selenomonadaceae bacterium]